MLSIWAAVAAIVLPLAAPPAQHVRRLLDDSNAKVSLVEIPAGGTYLMHAPTASGSVWVAIDSHLTLLGGAAKRKSRSLPAGAAGKLGPGKVLEFGNSTKTPLRLAIVEIKASLSPVTFYKIDLAAAMSMQDATPGDKTLVVALSPLELKDVVDLGSEGSPRPGKPVIIKMEPATVRWIRAGMHKITNLLDTPVQFVMVEF